MCSEGLQSQERKPRLANSYKRTYEEHITKEIQNGPTNLISAKPVNYRTQKCVNYVPLIVRKIDQKPIEWQHSCNIIYISLPTSSCT